MDQKTEYKLIKYAGQPNTKSRGVAAGMWAVVRITEEDIAFADSEDQALRLLNDLRKVDRVSE